MEMLCRRASLAVSSFARDSTGTKDLNGISELSRCYLKNEESATEREARFDVVDCTPTAVSLASHFDERPAESRHGLRRFSRGIGGGAPARFSVSRTSLSFLIYREMSFAHFQLDQRLEDRICPIALVDFRFGQQRALRRETDVANQRSRTTIRDTIKRPPYPVLGRSFPGWSLLGLFRSLIRCWLIE
ncbi:hypothetical protein L1987_89373 [Smallanthus sonchifolius]|nr:hypothetical protein L1987_89373 [Smallanthus sonchifolius]